LDIRYTNFLPDSVGVTVLVAQQPFLQEFDDGVTVLVVQQPFLQELDDEVTVLVVQQPFLQDPDMTSVGINLSPIGIGV
jgi:hypothetical protein